MTTDPSYPIGKYIAQPFDETLLQEWLSDIKFLPQMLENSILNWDAAQLDTPYREGGWTVKQLIHHVADSHMNAYIRFKLRLTQESLVITPYDEKAWAELPDTHNLPVNISLTLLHALHLRWHEVLKNMTREDFDKTVFHPEHKRDMSLWFLLGLYAWHGKHHVAHITAMVHGL